MIFKEYSCSVASMQTDSEKSTNHGEITKKRKNAEHIDTFRVDDVLRNNLTLIIFI